MYIAQPGMALIEVINVDVVKRFGPAYVKKMLMTGGLFVVHIPKGAVAGIAPEMRQLIKQVELDCATMLEGTSTIQVVKEYKDRLTQKDLDALLWHEQGHIHYGHELPENAAKKKQVDGIIMDLETELQADAFAARKVGKRNVAIALTHAVEAMAEIVSTRLDTIPQDRAIQQQALNAFLFNDHFRARIGALQ